MQLLFIVKLNEVYHISDVFNNDLNPKVLG